MAGAGADQALLGEAADWLITLHYEQPSAAEREAFERWRAQSAAHGAAWQRAESMRGAFAQVPAEVCRKTLGTTPGSARRPDRRRSLALLGSLLVAAPTGWLAWRELHWREWMADQVTATGEQRTLTLPDGSRLTLNTASAVALRFTGAERRVRLLAGEILVTTQADPRPFLVQTREGTAQALGTRFSVRRIDEDTTRVAVFEHAVALKTVQGTTRRLAQGSAADFGAAAIGSTSAVEPSAALWERGMLLARNMRLAEVLGEMARYRRGALHCAPGVAGLRVSGALSLKDTDASLALLAQSLPVRIARQASGAVMVGPR